MIEAFVIKLSFIEKKYLLNMVILVLNIKQLQIIFLTFMFTVLTESLALYKSNSRNL
jgi:hypothetical protein